MKITDISELPELLGFDMNKVKDFLERHKDDNDGLDYSILKFKEFWLLCECPVPIVFKYKNRYFITRDKSRFGEVNKKMSEKKMEFAEISALPKTNRGKQGKDYLSILEKIPIGKMWIPAKDEVNASTIRKAITELEESKKVKKGEFTATQRTVKDEVQVYVLHNQIKQ